SKQAKNEQLTRLKSKFLELKPFESSSSSKPSPNLELEIFKNLCLADYSTLLVEITDQLGDPPFGRFHHRLALTFDIGSAHLNKRRGQIIWRHAEWLRRSANLNFSILSAFFVPFCSIVSMPFSPSLNT
ncbi:hypothetical protein H5410_002734, partial [Solanum commersonii]